MPHMAPIMWTLVMFYSLFLMLLLTTMIYFSNSPDHSTPSQDSYSNLLFNWKW